MSDISKLDSLLRLRPTSKEASGMVVLLGYDMHHFLEALMECEDIEVLRDVARLLPVQVNKSDEQKERCEMGQRLVASRIAKLEEEKA